MVNKELLRKEHEAVRKSVGFFDFAHDILEVSGKDAQEFLDYVCVNVISDLKPNRASYTTILNEDAIALDDVIVFNHGNDVFWITTLFMEELSSWLKDKVGDLDVKFKDITEETALYSVQGPKSKDVLNKMLKDDVEDLRYFEFNKTKLNDIDVMVSRTGFTGELGYELYFHPKYTDEIVKALNENGKEFDIIELTTDVTLTSLPTEKGYITVDDFKGANPIELGLEWSVDCDKDFIGKDKLCVLVDRGPDRKLVGFTVDDPEAEIEIGNKVKADGKEIGEVTTVTYGFTVEKNIGYAMLDIEYTSFGREIVIVNGDKEIEATVNSDRVFYDASGSRVRG